jgi:hypothetical protein
LERKLTENSRLSFFEIGVVEANQTAVSERVEDDVFRSPKAQEIRRQSACVTKALRTTHSIWLYFAVEILLWHFRIAI